MGSYSTLLSPAYLERQGSGLITKYYIAMAGRDYVPVYWPSVVYTGSESFDSTLNRKPLFNNCNHVIDRMVNYAYGALVASYYNQPYATKGTYVDYYRLAPGTADLSPTTYTAKQDFAAFDAASRRAWWEMRPRFEGEVSMLNFLFELKDFKDIAKYATKFNWRNIASQLSSFKQKTRLQPFGTVNRTFGQVAARMGNASYVSKKAAELHLLNEFAIKPLISDVGHILMQARQLVNEVQAEFAKKGLAPQVRHYSEQVVHTDTRTPQIKGGYYLSYSAERHVTIFTATLEYSYDYKLRSDSDAFAKYWGLKLTPEVIWNAIPFSFLIDYFIKVGNAFHSMGLDPNVKVLKHQYCESILQKGLKGCMYMGGPNRNFCIDGKLASDGDLIGGREYTSYCRRVTEPNKGLATPRFSLPSGKQGLNMAALARCFVK
jgi:hypothetical protein